jgi:hypothetical protein
VRHYAGFIGDLLHHGPDLALSVAPCSGNEEKTSKTALDCLRELS